jgi:hypothetical protein
LKNALKAYTCSLYSTCVVTLDRWIGYCISGDSFVSAEGSFSNGFPRLQKKFAPTEKVCAYRKSLRLQKKFAPTEKVCAYGKRLRQQNKFAPTEKVCAYGKSLRLRKKFAPT